MRAEDLRRDSVHWDTSGDGTLARPLRKVQDVAIQDQTTPAIFMPLHKNYKETVTTALMVVDGYTIEVEDATGSSIGDMVIVYNPSVDFFSRFFIVAIDSNILSIDSAIDIAYPVGSSIELSKINLAVDGSTTPQVFGIRGASSQPPLQGSMDLTCITIMCKTTTAVTLAKFGDLTKLTRGLLIRHRNSFNINLLNFKSNEDFGYYYTPYAATNPVQGQNGFIARIPFAGQENIGVVLRIGPGEDVEFIVQDDLSTIISLYVIAKGHVVDN